MTQVQTDNKLDGKILNLMASTPSVCPVGSRRSMVSNQDVGRNIWAGPNAIFCKPSLASTLLLENRTHARYAFSTLEKRASPE